MNGKVVVVTGGNSGIGLETARVLSALDARVILACRNAEKASVAQADIEASTGHRPEVLALDLASLDAVRASAAGLVERCSHIDVLINNAGTFATSRAETADGFERTLGTNHLGPLLFTALLLPLLRKADQARIIHVSSEAALHSQPDLSDLQMTRSYGRFGFDAYARSKAAQAMASRALASRLEGSAVTVNAVHPGHVATNIWPRHALVWRAVAAMQSWFALTPAQAAPRVVFLATTELDGVSGEFFKDDAPMPLPHELTDENAVQAVWARSLGLVGLDETHFT